MIKSQNRNRRTHAASVVITLGVILMLVFSGPSSAVMVELTMDGMNGIEVGQSGFFYFNVTIGGNERIPIADFSIEGLPSIEGSPDGELTFALSDVGTTVGGATTIGNYQIELVEIQGWTGGSDGGNGYESNYGYAPYAGYGQGYAFDDGYGYGYESASEDQYTTLAYKVTVNTTGADVGPYDAEGKVNTGASDKPYFAASATPFVLVASDVVTTVSIEDITVDMGESVVVPIMIAGAENLSGCAIDFEYDSSVVHVTDVTSGDMQLLASNVDNGTGWMYANAADPEGLNGDVVFAYVQLTAVGVMGDESLLDITVDQLLDTGYNPINYTVTDGLFTIMTETVPPVVTDVSASLDVILNGNGRARAPGTDVTTITATVTDADSGVSSATIDLSSIGGSEVQPMERIGTTDVWTVDVTATDGINETNLLVITATDDANNSDSSASIELTVLRRGDVYRDNVIDSKDVLYIARYLAELEPEASNPPSILVGDVVGIAGVPEGDGVVDLMDALYLMRCEAGLEVQP